MPRTTLTIQECLKWNGKDVTLTSADAPNGMNYANDGSTVLLIQNAAGSAVTVTVQSVADPETGRTGNLVQTVTNSNLGIIGPLQPNLFNQADGTVYVDFSSGTSIKVAAVRLKNTLT